MTSRPLTELLSEALIAFTIEFDNEFEHRMPHRTSTGPAARSGRGPWLVSQAMWTNFMRFVAPEGTPEHELRDAARMTNLGGLQRWGYVLIGPDRVVRPTRAGSLAQEVWRPLGAEIERRWRKRFGANAIQRLRAALAALDERLARDVPDYLPVLGHGFRVRVSGRPTPPSSDPTADGDAPDLSALFSRILLAFTEDFDLAADLALPLDANLLWAIDRDEVRVRDLPQLAGISKEAVSMGIGYLRKRGCVVTTADPGRRGEVVRLTPAGRKVADADRAVRDDVERAWNDRYGADLVAELRAALEQVIGAEEAGRSLLIAGLEPYPDGWRAHLPRPERLPRYPVVLHRGGYPDGS